MIERKVDVMKKEGITFVTGADVGRNYRAGKIRKEFDRIILACGASNPRDIDVPGRDSAGIYFAVDFLKPPQRASWIPDWRTEVSYRQRINMC